MIQWNDFMKRIFAALFFLFLPAFLAEPVFACDVNVQCENIANNPGMLNDCSPGDTLTLQAKCDEAMSSMEKAAQPKS